MVKHKYIKHNWPYHILTTIVRFYSNHYVTVLSHDHHALLTISINHIPSLTSIVNHILTTNTTEPSMNHHPTDLHLQQVPPHRKVPPHLGRHCHGLKDLPQMQNDSHRIDIIYQQCMPHMTEPEGLMLTFQLQYKFYQ